MQVVSHKKFICDEINMILYYNPTTPAVYQTNQMSFNQNKLITQPENQP